MQGGFKDQNKENKKRKNLFVRASMRVEQTLILFSSFWCLTIVQTVGIEEKAHFGIVQPAR